MFRKIALLVLTSLLSLCTYAQINADSLVQEGRMHMIDGDYNSALRFFQVVIGSGMKDQSMEKALFDAGQCYYILNQYDEAIVVLQKVIRTHFKHVPNKITEISFYTGREEISSDKSKACEMLADIYMQRGVFKEALLYLEKQRKYPRYDFCGNGSELHQRIYYSKLADCYIKVGANRKAMKVLWNHLTAFNEWCSYDDMKKLKGLLKQKYDDDIKQEIQKAGNSIKIKIAEGQVNGYVRVFHHTVSIPMPYGERTIDKKTLSVDRTAYYQERYRALYTSSDFYKLLTN